MSQLVTYASSYKQSKKVFLNENFVGMIRLTYNGYQFFPEGSKRMPSVSFDALSDCQYYVESCLFKGHYDKNIAS
jgi:hypothetical protein